MAALQSLTEGHPPKPPSRSFLDVLSSQAAGILRPRSTNTYRGFPSIAFSAEEISDFSAPFRHALIGKFSSGRPPMESIRKAFISIGFAGTYSLGLIDYRHILIKFNIEEDYVRAFLKRIYTIDGFTMRLFKWSTDFSVDSESAIVPIWINFPLLPLHFFNKEALYNIARLIGEPLKMDASTAALTRPSVARVCVELDLRKARPEKIWLVNGGTGIWQPVDYEKVPPLCSQCLKIGHQAEACRSADSRPKPSTAAVPSIPSLSQKMRMEYRPKVASAPILKSIADKEKETLLPHLSKAAVTEVAATDLMKTQNFSLNTAVSDVPSVSITVAETKATQSGESVDEAVFQHPPPSVNKPEVALFPTVAAAEKIYEPKEFCSTVGVSNFNPCLPAPLPIILQSSVPPDLLAVFPTNDAMDSVANPPELVADCNAYESASVRTDGMLLNELPNSMSEAVPLVLSDAAEAAVSQTSLVSDPAPSLNGVLNPNAPLFNPQSHPYAWFSKSFAAALLGETRILNVSEKPLFFAVKSSEFPTFQMPQYAEFYTSRSFIPPDEATTSFPREDLYTFSDGDDVPRWPASRELISASLKSFNKKLQAKFSMHPRFFCCPKHRKNWKKRAPLSTSSPALSSSVPPPLNALTFHGPNPYEENLDDNDSVDYESVWRSASSDDENSLDYSIPLSSEAALLALEFEDFSPPARRKYNKRFRDLPAPMTTRSSRNRS